MRTRRITTSIETSCYESLPVLHRPADLRGVLSALILLAGLIALPQLPISEYPEVVPPTVVVQRELPGRQPEGDRRDRGVAAGAGDQRRRGHAVPVLAGDRDGAMTLTVTFKLGTDVDKAQVQVQNRVAQALPKLPQDVQRLGVTTNKASPELTHGRCT